MNKRRAQAELLKERLAVGYILRLREWGGGYQHVVA
jgi:hypothetical protein